MFRRAALGYMDWNIKEYRKIPGDEQVKVVSVSGNLSRLDDGTPKIRAHAVVGTSQGAARCGHVLSDKVVVRLPAP